MSSTILVVEDEELMREFLEETLTAVEDYDVLLESNAEDALSTFKNRSPDAVIADVKMPGSSGLDLLENIRALDEKIPVIIITAYAEVDTTIQAIRNTVTDFLRKPFESEDILDVLKRHLSERRSPAVDQFQHEFVFSSDEMEQIVNHAKSVAKEEGPILIQGESGVGKEVLARFIHYQSDRSELPFMSLNCGSIPGDLLESELFGHEEGAFTGATTSRKGLFQSAEGGTLLLDEIGELPLDMQAKLLRVLETRQLRPVGSDAKVEVDVRIMAATNRNLQDMLEEGDFREDLFFRLNVFDFTIPPLRERIEDIPTLINFFMGEYKAEFDIPDQVMDHLKQYPWPGNVREIENMIRRLKPVINDGQLTKEHLSSMGISVSEQQGLGKDSEEFSFPPDPDLQTVLKNIKRDFIERALERANGNKSEAADLLGMKRTTLVETINRFKEDFT